MCLCGSIRCVSSEKRFTSQSFALSPVTDGTTSIRFTFLLATPVFAFAAMFCVARYHSVSVCSAFGYGTATAAGAVCRPETRARG